MRTPDSTRPGSRPLPDPGWRPWALLPGYLDALRLGSGTPVLLVSPAEDPHPLGITLGAEGVPVRQVSCEADVQALLSSGSYCLGILDQACWKPAPYPVPVVVYPAPDSLGKRLQVLQDGAEAAIPWETPFAVIQAQLLAILRRTWSGRP